MKLTTLLLVTVATLGAAAPSTTLENREALEWSPALAEYYSKVEKHVRDVKRDANLGDPLSCDLSLAQMPPAPTPLPAPKEGYTLKHVAIGRGVQNYTCDITNTTAVPVAIGAVANLYNASCVAASYPDLLSLLPNLVLQVPYPASTLLPPSKIQQSGIHYFSNSTTPVFDFSISQPQKLGVAPCAKAANSTAPKTAIKGVDGSGNGAVSWLQLNTRGDATGDLKSVYRLNTAGGSPPKTCQGMPPSFSVQYAAEYWFWGM